MDQYQETFETWDKIAAKYEDKFMYLDIYNKTYNRFCETLSSGHATLLEIGCGPGNITNYILSKMPGCHITGIDVAPNMIVLAQKNNPAASFKVMDCRQIDELERAFDGIICGFCLPYLSEADCVALIGHCAAMLTGGGVLYLSFVEGDPADSGFQAGSTGSRVYFYYHSLVAIEKLLSENGFEMADVSRISYEKGDRRMEVHTVLIAKKVEKVK